MIKEIDSIKFIYKGKLKLDEDTENKVKNYWNEIQKQTDLLHEARILVVSNVINNQANYQIELQETTFSNYMYTKENKTGDIKALFSAAYILTSDNCVVCELNNYYENGIQYETLNLVGGMADAEDITHGEYSSQTCLKRELKEELGIDIEDGNWNIKLKYIKCPSDNENQVRYSIGTIYEIKTKHTKEQIQEMFEHRVHDEEVKGLVFFSKENYEEIDSYKHKKQYMPELFSRIFE